MQGDSELHPDIPPRRDLWTLPKIRRIAIERRRYDPPRRHAIAGAIVEVTQGTEIIVETTEAIPMRALSPALYVGGVEVAENEQVDATTLRFFVADERALRAGAPIVLGWAGHPPSTTRSSHRYEPPPPSGTTR